MISKSFFLKITESWVANLIQRSVPKDLQEGLVVNCDHKITASQIKISCLVERISNGRASPLISAYFNKTKKSFGYILINYCYEQNLFPMNFIEINWYYIIIYICT